jgi:hypothetical protein
MQGNIGDSLEEQRELMREWERIYNNEQPVPLLVLDMKKA